MTNKKILIGSIIGGILLAVIVATIATVAYLTSRRSVRGYINFASGIKIQYTNIRENNVPGSYGNLYYLNEETDEKENLELNDILPGVDIKVANPTLHVEEGSASFALRSKLVITASNSTGNYVFDTNEEYEFLTETTSPDATQIIFASGVIAFDENWELNEADGYYYYINFGEGEFKDRLVELDENSEDITVLNADNNSEYLTLTTVDGQPIENFNYSSLLFELYLEAIQYSNLDIWFNNAG